MLSLLKNDQNGFISENSTYYLLYSNFRQTKTAVIARTLF